MDPVRSKKKMAPYQSGRIVDDSHTSASPHQRQQELGQEQLARTVEDRCDAILRRLAELGIVDARQAVKLVDASAIPWLEDRLGLTGHSSLAGRRRRLAWAACKDQAA